MEPNKPTNQPRPYLPPNSSFSTVSSTTQPRPYLPPNSSSSITPPIYSMFSGRSSSLTSSSIPLSSILPNLSSIHHNNGSLLDNALVNLDEEQRTAVDYPITTPLAIIAGPGSGKTHMLTCRVGTLLTRYTNHNGSSIILFTFTKAAAVEMRLRLTHLMNPKGKLSSSSTVLPTGRTSSHSLPSSSSSTASSKLLRVPNPADFVTIQTFHSFARRVCLHFIHKLNIIPGAHSHWTKHIKLINNRYTQKEIAERVLINLRKESIVQLAKQLQNNDTEAIQKFHTLRKTTTNHSNVANYQSASNTGSLTDALRVLWLNEENDSYEEAYLFSDGLLTFSRNRDSIPLKYSKAKDKLNLSRIPSTNSTSSTTLARGNTSSSSARAENMDKINLESLVKTHRTESKNLFEQWTYARALGYSYQDCDDNGDLGYFAERYTIECSNLNMLDFTEMIRLATRILRECPEARQFYGRLYRHILVDEFQDTSPSQFALIQELVIACQEYRNNNSNNISSTAGLPNPQPYTSLSSTGSVSVTVVGDHRQSVYSFQGGKPECFQYLKNVWPTTHYISLRNNYRSQAHIVSAFNAVMLRAPPIPGIPSEPSRPKLSSGEGIITVETYDNTCEMKYVLDTIHALVQRNIPFGHIAVLGRTNQILNEYETLFRSRNVPYLRNRQYGSVRPLRILLAALKVLVDDENDTAAIELVRASTTRNPSVSNQGNIFLRQIQQEGVAQFNFMNEITGGNKNGSDNSSSSTNRNGICNSSTNASSYISAARELCRQYQAYKQESITNAPSAKRSRSDSTNSKSSTNQEPPPVWIKDIGNDVEVLQKVLGHLDSLRSNIRTWNFSKFLERTMETFHIPRNKLLEVIPDNSFGNHTKSNASVPNASNLLPYGIGPTFPNGISSRNNQVLTIGDLILQIANDWITLCNENTSNGNNSTARSHPSTTTSSSQANNWNNKPSELAWPQYPAIVPGYRDKDETDNPNLSTPLTTGTSSSYNNQWMLQGRGTSSSDGSFQEMRSKLIAFTDHLESFIMDEDHPLHNHASNVSNGNNNDAVSLCTCHASKGREWPYVILVRANDGVIPLGKETISNDDDNDEYLDAEGFRSQNPLGNGNGNSNELFEDPSAHSQRDYVVLSSTNGNRFLSSSSSSSASSVSSSTVSPGRRTNTLPNNNNNTEPMKGYGPGFLRPSVTEALSSARILYEEERRLFFVAVSRAKKQIYIVYPQNLSGNMGIEVVHPSPFLTDILNESKSGITRTDGSGMPLLLHPYQLPSINSDVIPVNGTVNQITNGRTSNVNSITSTSGSLGNTSNISIGSSGSENNPR